MKTKTITLTQEQYATLLHAFSIASQAILGGLHAQNQLLPVSDHISRKSQHSPLYALYETLSKLEEAITTQYQN